MIYSRPSLRRNMYMNKLFIVLIVSMSAHSSFAMENGGKIEDANGNSNVSFVCAQSVDSLHRQASTVQAMTELAVACKEINSAITRIYNIDKILNVVEEDKSQNDQDTKNRSKEVTNKSKELITRTEESSKICLRLIDLVTAKAVVSPENKQALKNLQILMAMCAHQES